MIDFLLGFRDYVLVFLAMITVVVFVHEMGHYLVARANGVRVETFSIGFGPELFGRTAKSGTRWKICLLPLGGYVRMFGDADAPGISAADRLARLTPDERRLAFLGKRLDQRAAVVVAGPLANFVFGILVLAVMFSLYGEPRTQAVIGEVQPDSAAAAAGLLAGDRIVEANGDTVASFQDLQRIVRLTVGDPVTLVVERAGQRLSILTRPRMSEVKDALGNTYRAPVLGVIAPADATTIVRHDPAGAVWAAVRNTGEMVSATLTAVGQMIAGERDTNELRGPLRIAKGAGAAARLGFATVVYYAALISINLGLVNLFPVPLLDGGHLLFYGIEALRGRPLGPRAQEYGFRFGLILVFALMLLATRNDLADLKVWDIIKSIVS